MAGFGGFGALLANLLQPAGMAAAGGTQGVVEGNEEARKIAIENLRQQLLQGQLGLQQGQLDLQRMQMTQGKVMDVGGRLVQVAPNGQVTPLPIPPGPLSPVQEAQIGQYKARTKESEARTKEIETRGVGKGSIPAEHIRLFEDWQQKNPGGSYLDFYKSEIKPPHTSSSEPKSFEGWESIAADPSRPKEERDRARAIANSIKSGKIEIAGTEAKTRAEIGENVRIRTEERQDEKKKAADLEKRQHALARTRTMLNQMDALVPGMAKKGFLMSSASPSAYAMAEARRSPRVPFLGRPGDPTLDAWNTHESTMVSVARDLGDLGPRAQSAFRGVQNIIAKPTTPAGAKAAIQQLRDAVEAYHSGREMEYEAGTWQPGMPGTPKGEGKKRLRYNESTGNLE